MSPAGRTELISTWSSLCPATSYPPSGLSLLAASSRKPSWVLLAHSRLPSAQLTSHRQPCNHLFPGPSAHTSDSSAPAHSRSLYLRSCTMRGLEPGSQSVLSDPSSATKKLCNCSTPQFPSVKWGLTHPQRETEKIMTTQKNVARQALSKR